MAYAGGDVLVRAIMQADSGLPVDRVVNDFAFATGASIPTEAEAAIVFGAIDDFYNTAHAEGKVAGRISEQISRSATHTLAMYRIVVGDLGSPIWETDWLGPDAATSSNGVPTECAAVLSFHADLSGISEEVGATRPKARRRGRVYIGPLTDAAIVEATPPYLLDPDLLTCMRKSALALAEADLGWSVWSRADEILRLVVGGWTDNAPDTQRRRGPDATARVSWSV